jgi:uncharacterized damage-inducible protein DinB
VGYRKIHRMTIAETLLPEFDQEMKVTRRVLERVPTDKGTWKPHEKSFSIGHLAQLLSWMPGWITNTLTSDSLNLAGGAGYSYEKTEKLLEDFDRNVKEARAAIAASTDADFAKPWSLKMGDKVLMTLPRSATTRSHLSHLVHHRGQMSVYLRLLDIPVPSLYGPTADEPWSA